MEKIISLNDITSSLLISQGSTDFQGNVAALICNQCCENCKNGGKNCKNIEKTLQKNRKNIAKNCTKNRQKFAIAIENACDALGSSDLRMIPCGW